MANLPKFKLRYMENGLYKVKLRTFTGEGEYGIDNGIINRDFIVKINKKTPSYATELLTGYKIPLGYLYVGGIFRNITSLAEIDKGRVITEKEIKERNLHEENKFYRFTQEYKISNKNGIYSFFIMIENIDSYDMGLLLEGIGRNTLLLDSETNNLLELPSNELNKIIDDYKNENSIDEILDLFEALEVSSKEKKQKWLDKKEVERANVEKQYTDVQRNYKKYYDDDTEKTSIFRKIFKKISK